MKITRQVGGSLPRIVTTAFRDGRVGEITNREMRSANRQTRVRPLCRLINTIGQAEILKFRVDRIGVLSDVWPKRRGRELAVIPRSFLAHCPDPKVRAF